MAGVGPFGRNRIESNLEAAQAAAQDSASRNRSGRNSGQIRTAAAYESTRTDFGPWVETPNSSRVSKYRYDYLNDSMQVMWKNNIRAQSGPSSPTAVPGTVYGEMANGTPITYEMFRQFARAVSKGKAVNTMLNGWGYRGMSTDERDAPSNGRYRAPSRARD
ncbi:MAG: hypothetical protein EBR40_10400 [Proteobacteria bacterium]|nr:hypothetical protein [Pseudomonadota bacterium]